MPRLWLHVDDVSTNYYKDVLVCNIMREMKRIEVNATDASDGLRLLEEAV